MQKTNVSAQKINKFLLKTYGIVIAAFQVYNKLGRFYFFQETFLLVKISLKIVFNMLFLIVSNIEIQFVKKKLIWKTYTTKKTLSTIRQVIFIDKKEFAKVALNKNIKAFVIYNSSLSFRLRMTSLQLEKSKYLFCWPKKSPY